MTCIVGWVHDGRVTLGGDAAASAGLRVETRVAPKVFANGPMVMGFTSSFRMGDLLRWSLVVPARLRGERVDAYLRTTFIDEVRRILKAGGCAKTLHEVDSGGEFLVGYEGRLFAVEGDFQVGEVRDGFDAIGSGSEVARGALAVLGQHRGGVRRKMRTALMIAARYSSGVAPPFSFVTGGARS